VPTGQQIINAALTDLGILEQGGIPSTSDSNDALADLNSFWDAWGIDEGLIYAVQTKQYALTQNVGTYAIGLTAGSPFNVPLPSRIYSAFFTTASGRNEIEIVSQQRYFAHNDLAALAVAPDELYPDFNVLSATGLANLYLWPVPSVAGASLELETGAPFGLWTLQANYFVPQGFQDAIQECLAFRLLTRFGAAVDQAIALAVVAKAQKAEQRIRTMNAFNRKLPPGAEMAPTEQPVAPGGAPGRA
jgi:hypothetical protein